jgi:pimeloyl-ACP methyl ester carboxylesterase
LATRTVSQVKTKTATIDGLSIRYAESAPREVSAILLSPWPESLYTFEQMWSRLAEHAHLVAIDLPGFGHSERRDDLLKPSAMAEFVVRAINEFGLNCAVAWANRLRNDTGFAARLQISRSGNR